MRQDIPSVTDNQTPENEYAALLRFSNENRNIPYSKFDACTTSQINLFALRENFDFDMLEQALDKIIATLPAIKRIFARPITRLEDTTEIRPVESVHIINNQTIVHASVHSELWSNITDEGVRPKKLLTRKNEDSYVIYENIGFARMVRIILHLVHQNIRHMREILYANRILRFNLLERDNHLSYFLALGKLHIGYVRDYDRYRICAQRCMDKLLFIQRTVRARLSTPVFHQCKDKIDKFKLKKSTIFRVHKDYHQIYLLLKWFFEQKIDSYTNEDYSLDSEYEGYPIYCNLLSVFAAGHFNFSFSEKQTLDFLNLHASAHYLKWKMDLDSITIASKQALMISVTKNSTYRILLLPNFGNASKRYAIRETLSEHISADEYVFASLNETDEQCIILNLYDLESFRRLQQLMLRAMIYADAHRDVCPFCGQPLNKDVDPETEMVYYTCDTCRMQILHTECPTVKRLYYATAIRNFKQRKAEPTAIIKKDKLLYNEYLEEQLFYRNITALGESAEIICPFCHQTHINLPS